MTDINPSDYTATDTMLLPDINMLALNLMLQHGLIEQGWTFSWDRAKSRLGCCKHSKKMITMSSIIAPGQSKTAVINVILHEIAHALVGPGQGHGPVWKAKARSIGCTGDRCAKIEAPQEFRWYAVCETCDRRIGMHRAPNRVRYCVPCTGSGSPFNYIMSWEQFGRTAEIGDMPVKFQAEWYRIQERIQYSAALAEERQTPSYNFS